jgi:hypothetical protein
MTEPKVGFDPTEFQTELSSAAAALQEFAQGPARRAASDVGVSFEHAGQRIARALGRAASDGEGSFKRLPKVILEELAKLALQRIFTQTGSKMPFFGARAAGGAANAGGAYLVGERGPELFVPRQSGQIANQPQTGAVSVHFHFSSAADAGGIVRSQGQIAATIARAVAYGRRNL